MYETGEVLKLNNCQAVTYGLCLIPMWIFQVHCTFSKYFKLIFIKAQFNLSSYYNQGEKEVKKTFNKIICFKRETTEKKNKTMLNKIISTWRHSIIHRDADKKKEHKTMKLLLYLSKLISFKTWAYTSNCYFKLFFSSKN